MANLGCDVFAFDPSMGNTGEHVRPSGVHFYPIGLGSKSMDDFTPRIDNYVKKNSGQKWKIRTLGDLVKELHHSERPIDMLKIDVESYEWEIIPNILQSGLVPRIKQMNMEFQIFEDTPPEGIPHFLNVYKAMKKAGFKQFHCRPSVTLKKNDLKNKRLVSECAYVNVNYAFRK
ncbi:probable methyltransferase-like protein 24 [Mytilus edulis]